MITDSDVVLKADYGSSKGLGLGLLLKIKTSIKKEDIHVGQIFKNQMMKFSEVIFIRYRPQSLYPTCINNKIQINYELAQHQSKGERPKL